MAESGPQGRTATDSFADLAMRIKQGPARLGAIRLVCIDGPAGSGKTTFADRLASELGSPVVHMDDLYEGWSGAFDPAFPLRLDAWLLTPWRHGLAGRHPVFDWAEGRYTKWRQVPAAPVVVLEGVGAALDPVRRHATEIVWVEAEQSVRLARLLRRDGEQLRERLVEFMQREQVLFEADGIRISASLLIAGDAVEDHAPTHYVRLT